MFSKDCHHPQRSSTIPGHGQALGHPSINAHELPATVVLPVLRLVLLHCTSRNNSTSSNYRKYCLLLEVPFSLEPGTSTVSSQTACVTLHSADVHNVVASSSYLEFAQLVSWDANANPIRHDWQAWHYGTYPGTPVLLLRCVVAWERVGYD